MGYSRINGYHVGLFIIEGRLTANYHLNFLQNELPVRFGELISGHIMYGLQMKALHLISVC
jgi:hypothetical protein